MITSTNAELISHNTPNNTHLVYRRIAPADIDEIKALHDELFPVKYSHKFFEDACAGVGMQGGELFTSIAIDQGRIVGFVLAQYIPLSSDSDERCLLGRSYPSPDCYCYILTIGCRVEYRQLGIASCLVQHVVDYASMNRLCGGVYLHVIYYNDIAVKFYEKNGFEYFKELSDFYYFEKEHYNAYLYVRYTNGYDGPFTHQLYRNVRAIGKQSIRNLTNWLGILWNGSTSQESSDHGASDAKVDDSGAESYGVTAQVHPVP